MTIDAKKKKSRPIKFIQKKDGTLQECRENVFVYLTQHPDWEGVLGFNEFSRRIMKLKPPPFESTPGEWATEDDYKLGMWLAHDRGLVIKSDAMLVSAVAMAAYTNKFHSVVDWLESLPPWDGTDRLEYFLADCTGCRQSDYSMLVGLYFMIGMIARVYQPGCPMQYVMILEGEQGIGKSTFWRILAGEWFQDTPLNLDNKDAYLQLEGIWLYEIAELDSINRSGTSTVKAFITQNNDRFREPYGRRVVDWPRQVVFVGTTNHYEYFKDSTGNRRFWPIKALSINRTLLAGMREQLFAEALHRYRKGEPWHPTQEQENTYFIPQQDHRRIDDPWLNALPEWLNNVDRRLINEFTALEILHDCFKVQIDKVDNYNQQAMRIARLMQELGWQKKRQASGDRKRVYVRPRSQRMS